MLTTKITRSSFEDRPSGTVGVGRVHAVGVLRRVCLMRRRGVGGLRSWMGADRNLT